MFRLFPLTLLGVATITASGIATLVAHSIVRSLSCFRCLIPGFGQSGVPFSGLVMMSNVTTPVPMFLRLVLRGLLPWYSGLVIGDRSILYSSLHKENIWEKELGAASRVSTISNVSGSTGIIVGLILAATLVPGLSNLVR
jgi:hypothetical protein